MGKKKLLADVHKEPEVKRPRQNDLDLTSDLSTDEVEIYRMPRNNEGIVMNGTFSSKFESQSIQQVKRCVEREDELNMGNKKFHLYPAFKEALLRLLTQIEEALTDESNTIRMILIHGVPNIGKTSLAQCLSYFLSLSIGGKEIVHYIKLSHSAKIDDSVLTDNITNACNNKYLIVDQVNTNTLKSSEILDCVESRLTVRGNRMPLLMFTSGHYTPSEKWLEYQKSKLLCYKLITMKIDAALVSKLRNSMKVPADVAISNDDLLKVTTCYSRMKECLNHLRVCDSRAKENVLQDVIYPGADLKLIQRDSAIHFIWLAWYEFLSKGLPPREEFTDDDCKMKPHHVEYLGYLISDIKDTKDLGINAILNLMEITGDTLYERNGYSEFNPNAYCYKFLHKRSLYDVLACTVDTQAELPPEKRLKIVLGAFNMLRKAGDSQYNYVKGGLFELLIKCVCERETELRYKPVGMSLFSAGLDFIVVDCYKEVATELELCDLPLNHKRCEEARTSFWCVLNVPGKQPFKGFDFAFMQTSPFENRFVVDSLQLFQVTISPEGKSLEKKLIMTDVLGKIKDELEKRKLIKRCDAEKVVVPYFVHPSADKKQLELPYRGSQRSIVVDILSFPQRRFGVL